jgi:hypothetical protein
MSGATSIPPDGIIRINEQLVTLLNSMALATPTTEPVEAGIVWRNNGVLTVSAGLIPVDGAVSWGSESLVWNFEQVIWS